MSLNSERMTAVLACPVNWIEETTIEHADSSVLEWDWYFTLRQQAVCAEDVDLYLEFAFDDEHTEYDLRNLEMRRPCAVEAYRRRAGRLAGLQFVTPTQHAKHAIAEAQKDVILARSRTGRSLFYENNGPSNLKSAFWDWFLSFFGVVNSPDQYYDFVAPDTEAYNNSHGKLWRKFLEAHHLRVAFDAIKPVGACFGVPTSLVCFDIHIDSKNVHCYPISRVEAVRIMGNDDDVEFVDALNC